MINIVETVRRRDIEFRTQPFKLSDNEILQRRKQELICQDPELDQLHAFIAVILIAARDWELESLIVEPFYKQLHSVWANLRKIVNLTLTFYEVAVERSFQHGEIMGGEVLVNEEVFGSFALPSFQGDERGGVAMEN